MSFMCLWQRPQDKKIELFVIIEPLSTVTNVKWKKSDAHKHTQ